MIEFLPIQRPDEKGFSLIEVLVAASLLIGLGVLLMGVINHTMAITSQASNQMEVTRIARESLDLIGRDISLSALPWARSNQRSLHFIVNPEVVKASTFANKDSIFWQAPLSRDRTGGNMAIVGYYVLRDFAAHSNRSRLQLRRLYVEPRSGNADHLIYSATGSNWITIDLLKSFAPDAQDGDTANAQRGWVADGVLGMWVRCLDKEGVAITNTPVKGFDSRALFQRTQKEWYPSGYSALPSFVEVTLLCIAPGDVVRVGKLEELPDTETDGAKLQKAIAGYIDDFRVQNPGAKSIAMFTRKFRILNSN